MSYYFYAVVVFNCLNGLLYRLHLNIHINMTFKIVSCVFILIRINVSELQVMCDVEYFKNGVLKCNDVCF